MEKMFINIHEKELTNNERELNNAYRYGENVNHPEHYNRGELEAIDVIEDWELNFNMGSVLKYISRYRYKQNKVEDLKKAIWYINREIECLEKSKY